MKRNLFRILIALFLTVIPLLSVAMPVYGADIDLPDVQLISGIEVYNDALGEDDSQVWLINFRCEYTTNTTSYNIGEAFLFVLKETATGNVVGATTAYPYYNDGFSYGIVSLEYSATNALTWNGNYTLYFYGNPSLDWVGGVPPSVNSNAITWIDEGSVADAQERLTTRLRYIASNFEAQWSIDLIETSSSGTVFTLAGEDYFTNSISNLRDMCPDLFFQSMTSVEYEHDILITDQLSSGSDSAQLINTTSWVAQTFTPSQKYDMTGVNIPVYRVGLPGNVTVSLRATAAGLPVGADLVSGSSDVDAITTDINGTWINVSFTEDYSLVSGTVYAIVVRTTVIGGTLNWLIDTDNGYASGQQCTSANSGVLWVAVPANDCLFEIEGRNAIIMSISDRVEDRLVGSQFDFTNWSNEWGLSRIWWSTIFWIAISAVIMVAASFGANSWDCSMVVLAIMVSYGWRGGWVDTIVFAMTFALLSGGVIYAVFWKRG